MRADTEPRKMVRQSGIELLRIIAMYLIVAHHMVVHNSFDFLGQPNSFRKVTLSLFEYAPGKIGIALFFIASAWFLSSGTSSLKKTCRKIWILEREILFWSIAALILQFIFDPTSVRLQQIVMALFPTITQLWWYTTCYALFLGFLPFISVSLRNLGRRSHKKLLIVMIAVWGCASFVPYAELNIGLNLIGFVYVYTLVTYYRWYMLRIDDKTITIVACICAVMLLTWSISLELLYSYLQADEYQALSRVMDREWSLPILGLSFGIFIVFSRMQFHSRVINAIASLTLGVYLITDHPFVRDILWTHWFAFEKYYQTRFPIVYFLSIVTLVFIGTLVLEAIRKSIYTFVFSQSRVFDLMWSKVKAIQAMRNV